MDPRPARARLRDVVLRWLVAEEAWARRTLTDPVAGAITLVFGLGIAGLTGLVAAKVYDAVTEHEGVAGLDRPVLSWMVGHRTPTLDRAVTWFTDLGSTAIMPWIATAAVVVLALLWRSWAPPLIMAAGTAGSLLMTTVGKAVVGRVRPPLSTAVAPYEFSFSFPSGHTLNTTVVAGVLAYLVITRHRRRGVLVGSVVVAAAFAGAMGLSRVYLGHHWFTDVLVAWALGVAWLALLITGHRIWQLRLPGAEPVGMPPDPVVDGDAHPGAREGFGEAQGWNGRRSEEAAMTQAGERPSGTASRGRVRTEPGRKRVRALLDGRPVFDTTHPLLVWEVPYFPAYYIPVKDVAAELVDTGGTTRSPSRGTASVVDVRVGGRTAVAAAHRYDDSPIDALRGHVRFVWDAMDEWLEEDEPIYGHPRDPYSRVDILASSRHVEVRIDGVLVADSRQPRILYETGLPPRYYLPMSDVRMDLLRPSEEVSHCPYKGTAGYWDVALDDGVHAGIVWCYRTPLPESMKIAGLLAFYDEKVDVTIDGIPQDRPRSHFS